MARGVYSILMFSGAIPAGSEVTVAAPAGHTYILRDLQVVLIAGDTASVTLQAGILNYPFVEWRLPPGTRRNFPWQGRLVLPAGAEAFISVTGPTITDQLAWAHLSGYDLTAQ